MYLLYFQFFFSPPPNFLFLLFLSFCLIFYDKALILQYDSAMYRTPLLQHWLLYPPVWCPSTVQHDLQYEVNSLTLLFSISIDLI